MRKLNIDWVSVRIIRDIILGMLLAGIILSVCANLIWIVYCYVGDPGNFSIKKYLFY